MLMRSLFTKLFESELNALAEQQQYKEKKQQMDVVAETDRLICDSYRREPEKWALSKTDYPGGSISYENYSYNKIVVSVLYVKEYDEEIRKYSTELVEVNLVAPEGTTRLSNTFGILVQERKRILEQKEKKEKEEREKVRKLNQYLAVARILGDKEDV